MIINYHEKMTSALITYLNEHFPTEQDWTFKDLERHFGKKFQVSVKRDTADLREELVFLFKYSDLTKVWTELVRECRGCILQASADGWIPLSRPWDKFFNLFELEAKDQAPEIQTSQKLVEKVDGSCIQVWWCSKLDKWYASTLGSISTSKIAEDGLTFAETFWKLFREVANPDYVLDRSQTYLFELCSDNNQIVTKYSTERVYFLGQREVQTGQATSLAELVEIAKEMNVLMPTMVPSKSSFEEIRAFVDAEAKSDKYGVNPEGWILYDADGTPLAKLKNSSYLALHRKQSSPKELKLEVMRAFFDGTADDLVQSLPKPMLKFLEKIEKWWQQTRSEIFEAQEKLYQQELTDKEFALALKSYSKVVQSLFFKNRQKILTEELDLEFLASWAKTSCGDWVSLVK